MKLTFVLTLFSVFFGTGPIFKLAKLSWILVQGFLQIDYRLLGS